LNILRSGWKRGTGIKKNLNKLLYSLFFLLILSCTLEVRVKEVIDGDTFVTYSGEKVRLIGIDTPERGRFFYYDARDALKKLIEGKKVKLEFDIVKKDIYNRILAYVFVDTIFVNDYMLRNGYSYIYTFPPNLKYIQRFRKSLDFAIKNKKGMWKYFLNEKDLFIGDPEKFEFHRRRCSRVPEIPEYNRVYFKSSLKALLEGYHPHKLCNPVRFIK